MSNTAIDSQGRIVYIEPNNLPGEFAVKTNGVKADNITWAPEDLSIFVDLQVVIPSRSYRPSNVPDDSKFDINKSNLQSILSGVKLDKNKSFLTTDFTEICYQEIKNNQVGSKEALGINSIHIIFDSHLYPRVTMNFTDVRGAALMMPQEQYYYDINLTKTTGQEPEKNKICRSFFESFFKFPYPKFYLSVKGVYGTCVTFVLSVEDFKATFNSETGNFDVVVTFIGLMYGLYTDIPMNYLIIAPYLGENLNGETNSYWKTQTSPNGAFFFNEDDGEAAPICTFYEFKSNYENILYKKDGDVFLEGKNTQELLNINEQLIALDEAAELFKDIPNNLENVEVYEYISPKKSHILFQTSREDTTGSFIFKDSFVKKIKTVIKKCEDNSDAWKFSKINGDIANLFTESEATFTPKICEDILTKDNNEKSTYVVTHDAIVQLQSQTCFTEDEVKAFAEWVANSRNSKIGDILVNCKRFISYDNSFLEQIEKRKSNLKKQRDGLESGVSKELTKFFKSACNFTPTVENIMRMVFAHLDTFIHEIYSVITPIGTKHRTLDSVKWDVANTDIETSGKLRSEIELPPFTAFYEERSGRKERIYPGEKSNLKNINEVKFVENLFDGLEKRLLLDAEENATPKTEQEEPNASLSSESTVSFMPIAVTDFYYKNVNPYNYLKGTDKIEDIFYFILCRLSVGYRQISILPEKEIKKKLTDMFLCEIDNLKHSRAWSKILKDTKKAKSAFDSDYMNFLQLAVSSEANDKGVGKGKIFGLSYEPNDKYVCFKKEYEYVKFNGVEELNSKELNRKDIAALYECDINVASLNSFASTAASYSPVNNFTENGYSFGVESKSYEAEEHKTIQHSPFLFYIDKGPIYTEENIDSESFFYDTVSSDTKTLNLGSIEKIPVPVSISDSTSKTAVFKDVNTLIRSNKTELWCPVLSYVTATATPTYAFHFYNPNDYSSIEEKAYKFLFYFLNSVYGYIDKEKFSVFKQTDYLFYAPKAMFYFLGGALIFQDVDIWQLDITSIVSDETAYDSERLKEEFNKWANGEFASDILPYFTADGIKYSTRIHGTKFSTNVLPPYKPDSLETKAISKMLALITSQHIYLLISDKLEKEKDGFPTQKIKASYFEQFFNMLKNSYVIGTGANVSNDNSENRVIDIEDNAVNPRLSLYYTLKNLYDRWLSSNTDKKFKLKSVAEEKVAKAKRMNNEEVDNYSEFDNFLYVDSFYNDISKDFLINPGSFYDIITNQIKGITNFNVLEFIGKICESNKLLFRCLPVYNNLYSVNTFSNIFLPQSLYSSKNQINRRIGNTYLIMYTYEPSHHLNLIQDKTNDVTYGNDSFDLADTFGKITPEAVEILKANKEGTPNICAFGVTPGKGNQSYFTKISVGMDHPRITDYAIMNKFKLADSVKGGRAGGIGEGQDLFSIYSNRSYDCNVEMLGCVDIMPMMYFQLNNVPMFKGAYMITKVEHTIQNNNMVTKFTGTRMPKRYIPFNKDVFNIALLESLISRLPKEERNKVSVDSDIELPSRTNYPNDMFYVNSAIKQMEQYASFGKVPITAEGKGAGSGRCAASVKTFVMAGFKGVFPAVNAEQANYIDSHYRLSSSFKANGSSFNGNNGYKTKYDFAALGFDVIAKNKVEMEKLVLAPGDICVMKHHSGNKIGHVCMYTGENWVSDFKQKNWWVYPNETPLNGDGEVIVYRYKKRSDEEAKYFGKWENGKFIEIPQWDNGVSLT